MTDQPENETEQPAWKPAAEMSRGAGHPTSSLALSEDVRIEPVPQGGRLEYFCPNCERDIPTRLQRRRSKPAKFETQLNDIFQCPYCSYLFSPKSTAVVLRR